MQHRILSSFAVIGAVAFFVMGGCSSDADNPGTAGGGSGGGGGGNAMGSPEPTGSRCDAAPDCYAGLDATQLAGAAECIDKVEDGYCTHECETDDDCCAVEGECRTGFKQVCSSFENSDKKLCFLSCEDEDLVPAGGGAPGVGGASAVDSNEYCEREAHPRFGCRSTGGGNENRKVCLPTGDTGAAGAGGAPSAPVGAGGAP